MGTKRSSIAEIHIATLLFGLAGLFGKWVTLSPFIIVLGRVFFASLTLGILILISRHGSFRVKKADLYLLLGLGFVLAVHWVSFFHSIQISTVAIGLLSYATFPVFTVFLEPVFSRERLDPVGLICAVICLFGVFMIIPRFELSDSTFQGTLWGILSGLTFAVLAVLNRRMSQKYPSLTIAFFQDASATIFLLPFCFVYHPGLDAGNIFLLIILGTLCTAGSHTLFIKGMRRVRAQAASLISSLEPVYGIALALLFLGEVPPLRVLAGGAVILGAAFFITLRERVRPEYPPSGH